MYKDSQFGSRQTVSRTNIRLIASILAAAFFVFILTGCSGTTGEEDDLSFLEEYEPAEKLEHAVVKFLFPGSEPKNWKNVKAELDKRTSNAINVSLDFKWIEFSQYLETVKTIGASNEIYDAFIVSKPEPFYPDFTALAREGRLKDISDIFPSSAPLLFSKYSSEELKYASVDNKLYAVPSLYPWARCAYLIVDDTLLRKYNLPDITDYENYELFLKTIKDNEPDLTPGTIANRVSTINLFARASSYVIADESKNLVYKWDDPEMKLIPWEKTPEFYEIINYAIDWYRKGYLVYEPELMKTASFIDEGQLTPPTEETSTMTFSSSDTQKIEQSNPMRAFHLYPEMQVQRDNPMGDFYYNGSFVFPAASGNTERALQFLEWVQHSRENYYLLMHGIEDEDYILTDGIPALPQGMDFFSSSYMYWDGCWAFENLEYEPQVPVYAESGTEMTFGEFLDRYSKYPPHGAFYPNYGAMQQGADERARIFKEFEYNLGHGKILNTAEVDAFIKRLDELGSDELAAEIHEQMMR